MQEQKISCNSSLKYDTQTHIKVLNNQTIYDNNYFRKIDWIQLFFGLNKILIYEY